jgi:hypothetical protein
MPKKYFCCYDYLFIFVVEYFMSFAHDLGFELLMINPNQYIYNEHDIYLFVQSVPENVLEKPTSNMYLLNIEQMTREMFRKQNETVLEKGIHIIDYSLENIQLLNNNKHIHYLPYQYNPKEVENLRELIKSTPKKYDVIFIGYVTPDSKRYNIINGLSQRGVNIYVSNSKWGQIRDMEVAKSKILLNIHYNNDYGVHEILRCDRWNLSGMIVVSERSLNTDLIDTRDLIIYEDYNNLIDKVIDVLNNYDSYNAELQKKSDETINTIATNRHSHLLNINDIINRNYENNHLKV